MSAAAVFLDRDGVLTELITTGSVERPARSLDELRIIPGVAAAIDRLRSAGFLLVAITNQPDVARGPWRTSSASTPCTCVRTTASGALAGSRGQA
jgi:D-glycero-D-manno-heptose 1,7-bisphosphate phosphatase